MTITLTNSIIAVLLILLILVVWYVFKTRHRLYIRNQVSKMKDATIVELQKRNDRAFGSLKDRDSSIDDLIREVEALNIKIGDKDRLIDELNALVQRLSISQCKCE